MEINLATNTLNQRTDPENTGSSWYYNRETTVAQNWKSGAIIAKPNSSGTQYFEAIIVVIKPTAGHTFL